MRGKWICAALVGGTLLLLLYGAAAGRRAAQTFGAGGSLPTLVIDAGHGGFDGGAVGANGTTEQDINLSVSDSVRALCGLFGRPAAMTRTEREALDYVPGRSVRENKVADIKARERIVKEIKNPVFLSIHLNKFEDAKYYGAQVFYSKNNPASRTLAEMTQSALIRGIENGNIRRAKPAATAIYLMKNLDCPAVIVECGFLSNPEEEQKLCDPGYQKQLALCIFNGYQTYLTEGTDED